MADTPVVNFPGTHVAIAKGVLRSQWLLVAGVTTCLPLDAPNYPDKTFSAHGTWGAATLVVEGSNDGTNYFALNDSRGEGNPISLTADNIVQVLENPRYMRAQTTGGTSTVLTVTFVSQSTQR